MTTLLAIDPATVCGVADTEGLRILWNLDNLCPRTHDGSRHLALGRILREQLKKHRYEYVAIELASFGASRQMATMAFHNELVGVIVLTCCEFKIPVLRFSPTQVKKFATGTGNAKKEQMVMAARGAGEKIIDHNIADAYWVMRLALQKLSI